jgi:DNA-binding MarR family transcriptional regulator
MAPNPEIADVARALQVSIGLLKRRWRQPAAEGELTLPELSALSRLDRRGPMTSAALAKLEQISPQSMGATLARLEARGQVERSSDPHDGRLVVISISPAGLRALWNRREARTEQLAQALSSGFTPSELRQLMAVAPLIERLAQKI